MLLLSKPTHSLHETPLHCSIPFDSILAIKGLVSGKIYNLARLHTKMLHDQHPIFLENLQDIRNPITTSGTTLLQGFLSMMQALPEDSPRDASQMPLIVSMHNTGKPTTTVVLVQKAHEDEALRQLAAIHSILLTNVSTEFHSQVFVGQDQVCLHSQQINSIPASHSANYASLLLQQFNPQVGFTVNELPPKRTWLCWVTMSCSTAAQGTPAPPPATQDTAPPHLRSSSLTMLSKTS